MIRLDGGVSLSESLTEGGEEIVAAEGAIIDASTIDVIMSASIVARRELAVLDDAAAE